MVTRSTWFAPAACFAGVRPPEPRSSLWSENPIANANAYAERVIATIRAECLDWSLILGRRHLDRTLRTYADHYNRRRPHRALDLATPSAGVENPLPVSPRDVRQYYGIAA